MKISVTTRKNGALILQTTFEGVYYKQQSESKNETFAKVQFYNFVIEQATRQLN